MLLGCCSKPQYFLVSGSCWWSTLFYNLLNICYLTWKLSSWACCLKFLLKVVSKRILGGEKAQHRKWAWLQIHMRSRFGLWKCRCMPVKKKENVQSQEIVHPSITCEWSSIMSFSLSAFLSLCSLYSDGITFGYNEKEGVLSLIHFWSIWATSFQVCPGRPHFGILIVIYRAKCCDRDKNYTPLFYKKNPSSQNMQVW